MSNSFISACTAIRQTYLRFGRLCNEGYIGKRVVEVVGPNYKAHAMTLSEQIHGLRGSPPAESLLAISPRFIARVTKDETVSKEMHQEAQAIEKLISELFVNSVSTLEVAEARTTGVSSELLEHLSSHLRVPDDQKNLYNALNALIRSLNAGHYGTEILERFQNAWCLPNESFFLLILLDHIDRRGRVLDLEPFSETAIADAQVIERLKISKTELITYLTQKNELHALPEQHLLMRAVTQAMVQAESSVKKYWEYVRVHFFPTVQELFMLVCRGANAEKIAVGLDSTKNAILEAMLCCLKATSSPEMGRLLNQLQTVMVRCNEKSSRDFRQFVLQICCELAHQNHGQLQPALQFLLTKSKKVDVAHIMQSVCSSYYPFGAQKLCSLALGIGSEHAPLVRREVAYFLLPQDHKAGLSLYFKVEAAISDVDLQMAVAELDNAFRGTDPMVASLTHLKRKLDRHQFLCTYMTKTRGYEVAVSLFTEAYPEAVFERRLFDFLELLRIYREESVRAANAFFNTKMREMTAKERFMLTIYAQLLEMESALPLMKIILSDLEEDARELHLSYFFLEYRYIDTLVEELKEIKDPEALFSILIYWIHNTETFTHEFIETIVEVLDFPHVKRDDLKCEELLLHILLTFGPESDLDLFWKIFELIKNNDSKVLIISKRYPLLEQMPIEVSFLPIIGKALLQACENQKVAEILSISRLMQKELQEYGDAACREAIAEARELYNLYDIEIALMRYAESEETVPADLTSYSEQERFYFALRCLADTRLNPLLKLIEPAIREKAQVAFNDLDSDSDD